MAGVLKWLIGAAITAVVLYFTLPLLGINPDTKRFYSDEAADEARARAAADARAKAMQRAREHRNRQ